MQEIAPDFGHWLAGFIDGEGSFNIGVKGPGVSHATKFSLGLRIDDRAILDEIVTRTGIGVVTVSRRAPRSVGERGETAVWLISSKAECEALVKLLDRYPLRAKKSRDYAIWRQAVLIRSASSYCREQPQLAALRGELLAGRR